MNDKTADLAGSGIGYYTEVKKIITRIKLIIRWGKNLLLNNWFFIPMLVVITLICSILNFNAQTQQGLIPAYLAYSNFILSGFDLKVEPWLYTFPMWGYGFVVSITQRKIWLILIQQLVQMLSIYYSDYSLKQLDWSSTSRSLYRLLCLTSLPWFFFHTVLWPYSWGASLLLFSIFSLFLFIKRGKIFHLILSGVFYGLMLNFRSDYYFFGLFLFVLMGGLSLVKMIPIRFWHMIVWISLVFILLVPWGIYSYHKTGHYLQKTTNKGHFLFISLGQLPENKWSITPFDKDSVMREIVDEELRRNVRTASLQADGLLTGKWLELIKNDPSEFLKKCYHNFDTYVTKPFYNGEIWSSVTRNEEDLIGGKIDQQIYQFSQNLAGKINSNRVAYNIVRFQQKMVDVILFLFLVSCIIYLVFSGKELLRDWVALIFFSLLFYQIAIVVIGFYSSAYNTNLYLIYILTIIYCLVEKKSIIKGFLSKFKRLNKK